MSSRYTIDMQLTELDFPHVIRHEHTGTKILPETLTSDLHPPLNVHHNLANCSILPVNSSVSNTEHSTPTLLKSLRINKSNRQSKCRTSKDTRPNRNATIRKNSKAQLRKAGSTVSVCKNVKCDGKVSVPQPLCKRLSKSTRASKKKTARKVKNKKRTQGRGKGKRTNKNAAINDADSDSEDSDNSDALEDDEEDEDEDEQNEEEERVALDVTAEGSGEHCCKVCHLTLPSAFRLQEHMHLHSGARPYRCAECGKQFCHLSNYRAHLRSHAQAAAARCRVCGTCFDTAESLQAHLDHAHLEEEFYQCDFCKRIFSCMEECKRHVESHRAKPTASPQHQCPQHQCPQCYRQFRRYKALQCHLQTHNCKNCYVCKECREAFPKKNALLRHSFSHLGLLPYTCVRCQCHFRLASLYRKHACNPQQIQCMACLGFFYSETDLQKHKKETGCWGHKGTKRDKLRCMECGQAFKSIEELRKHAGAHQRVLTCSECGKGFRSALLLMSHMGGHASSRPCLCQRCGVGFPHQQTYKSHQKDCGRVLSNTGAIKKQKTDLPPKPRNTPVGKDKPAESPDGTWRLTLDRKLPPGTTLVVFLPHQAGSSTPPGATLSKAISSEAAMKSEEPTQDTLFSLEEHVPTNVVVSSTEDHVPTSVVVSSTEDHVPTSVVVSSTEDHVPTSVVVSSTEDHVPTSVVVSSTEDHVPTSMVICPKEENGTSFSGLTAKSTLPHVSLPVTSCKPLIGRGCRDAGIPLLQVQPVRPEGLCDDRNRKVLLNFEGIIPQYKAGMGVKMVIVQEEDIKTKVNMNAEACSLEKGTAAEVTQDKKVVSPLKAVELCQALQQSCPTDVQSEKILSLVKKEEEYPIVLRDLDLQGCRVGFFDDLIAHKCEVRLGDVHTKREVNSEDSAGLRVNVKDARSFDFVEVEIWNDEIKTEEETGEEPHECLNCGQILLDGNLLEHYMKHASESHSCTQKRFHPLRSPPSRKRLKSQKRC